MHSAGRLIRALWFCAALGLLGPDFARAKDLAAARTFRLPADSAERALKRFSEQAGLGVMMATDPLRGVRSNEVSGRMSPREAMDRLIAGTGLEAIQDERTGAFAVRRSRRTQAGAAASTPMPEPGDNDPVELSPFEIVAQANRGWQTTYSLAGTRFSAGLADLPLTIQVVTSEFFNTIFATNLAEAVRYSIGVVPGASGAAQGNAGSNFTEVFRIRGLGVRFVYRDGTRNWRGNEPLFMDRVEIVKGPTAILYGESLPGGTLNYVTKMPQTQPGAALGLQVDSHGGYRAHFDVTGPLDARRRISYRLIAGHAGGRSFIEHMELEYLPLLASLVFRPTPQTKLYLSVEYLDRRLKNPQSNGTIAWRGPRNEGRTNPLSGAVGEPLSISPYAGPGTNPWGDPVLGTFFSQQVSSYTATWDQNLTRNLDFRSSWNFARTPQSNLGTANNDTNVIDAPLLDPHTRQPLVARPGSALVYLGNPYVVGQGSVLAGNRVALATPGAFLGGIQRAALYTTGPDAGPLRFVGNNLGVPGFFDAGVVGPRALTYSRNENRELNWKTDLTYRFEAGRSTHRVLVGYELYRGSYRRNRTVPHPAWSGNLADGVAGNITHNHTQDIYGRRWTAPPPVSNAFGPETDISRDGGQSLYGTYLGEFLSRRLHVLGGFRSADVYSVGVNRADEAHFRRTVPQVGALLKLAGGVGAYASYSESFGLNNARFTSVAPGPRTPKAYVPGAAFPPQEGAGRDIGLKFELLQGRLSGNLTWFDTEHTKIPVISGTVLDAEGEPIQFPVGAQHATGEELEVFFSPSANLQFTAGLTHLRAVYTRVGHNQEYLLGQAIGGTAEWQGSFFGRYTFSRCPLNGLSLAGGGYFLGDGAQGDLPRFPPGGYTVFDLAIRYEHRRGAAMLTYGLDVVNATGTRYYQDFTAPYPPRTIVLSLGLRY